MAYTDTKSNFETRGGIPADQKLTASEYNDLVADLRRHFRFGRTDVASQTHTASPWESLWVDTASAGGDVTVTLPADDDTADGDRVEVAAEDASNETDVVANTGQSIIGTNPSLTRAGDTVTLEYKASSSAWMVR